MRILFAFSIALAFRWLIPKTILMNYMLTKHEYFIMHSVSVHSSFTLCLVKRTWYKVPKTQTPALIPFPYAPMNNRTCENKHSKITGRYDVKLTAKIIQQTLIYGLNRSPILAHFQNIPHIALQTSVNLPQVLQPSSLNVLVLFTVHKSWEELMAVCACADEEEQHHQG